jgi:proteic killer suppression protein
MCTLILYRCQALLYNGTVIKSFRHAGLKALFLTGTSAKVRPDLQARSLRRLDALDQAAALADLRLPGMQFHRLQGKPTRYSLHVNGPWCITFEWAGGDAHRVDLEQYH